MPLFRGTFFLKSAELSVLVFEIYAELCLQFEETCRIMGLFGKVLHNYKEGDLALVK